MAQCLDCWVYPTKEPQQAGVSHKIRRLVGVPCSKDYSVWGFYVGVPLFREITNSPNKASAQCELLQRAAWQEAEDFRGNITLVKWGWHTLRVPFTFWGVPLIRMIVILYWSPCGVPHFWKLPHPLQARTQSIEFKHEGCSISAGSLVAPYLASRKIVENRPVSRITGLPTSFDGRGLSLPQNLA